MKCENIETIIIKNYTYDLCKLSDGFGGECFRLRITKPRPGHRLPELISVHSEQKLEDAMTVFDRWVWLAQCLASDRTREPAIEPF